MTRGPRNAPSPVSIFRPQFGQLALTLNARPGWKTLRRPQLGQPHRIPFPTIWARETFTGSGGGRDSPVEMGADLLEGHEARRHQLLELGHEGVYLLLAVHNLDDEREVVGEAQDLARVEPARLAVAKHATDHGRAREVHLPRLEHDR